MEFYCRLCGLEKLKLISIFREDEDGIRISDRICDYLLITISEDDLLPHKICVSCLETLDLFCCFVKKWRTTQNYLQKLLAKPQDNKDTRYKLLSRKRKGRTSGKYEKMEPLRSSRELFVCIPRLLPSQALIMKEQKLNEPMTDAEEPDFTVSEMRCAYSSQNIEMKQEIEEGMPLVESVLPFVDCSRTDDVDDKLEYEVKESLLTSTFDIPFEPNCPNETVADHESGQSNSIIGQLDKKTVDDNACSLKNIISNIFESQDIVIDDNNSLFNITFSQPNYKLQNFEAGVMRNYSSIALDANQLSDMFPNGGISNTDLKKLGAEVFYKHLPEILKTAQFQLNGDNLQKIVNNSQICLSDSIKEEHNPCASKAISVTDDCDQNGLSSSPEIVGASVPLPISCTVELVDIKSEVEKPAINELSEDTKTTEVSPPAQPIPELMIPTVLLSQIPYPVEPPTIKTEFQNTEDDLSPPNTVQGIITIEAPPPEQLSPVLKVPAVLLTPLKQNTMNAHNLLAPGTNSDSVETSGREPTSQTPEIKEKCGRRNHVYKCDTCSRSFVRKASYCKHLIDAHNNDKSQDSDDSRKSFSTKICRKQLKKGTQVRDDHSEQSPVRCDFCGVTFGERDLLIEHVKLHSSSRPYLCTICNSHFATRFRLNLHKTTKHSERTLNCSHCSYVAPHRYRLTQHHKEVHNKRLECAICASRFGKKSKLVLHFQRDHTERSPFKCYYCSSIFTQRHYYKEHLKTHSPDSRCVCSYCGLEFDRQYQLLMHISKTHEPKEIKCTQCSFTTLHKYHLKQHLREVHMKSFVCDICGKLESKKCRILVHIRNKHTSKETFTCDVCDATYYSKNWFIEHVKKH